VNAIHEVNQAIRSTSIKLTAPEPAFCGNCGTPLYACAVDDPQSYTLRIGAITQRAVFSPQRQIWRRSALNWVDAFSAMPVSETGFGGH
jgi:hypothetical protein